MKKTCGSLAISLLIATNAFSANTVKKIDAEHRACQEHLKIIYGYFPDFGDKKFLKITLDSKEKCLLIKEIAEHSYDIGYRYGMQDCLDAEIPNKNSAPITEEKPKPKIVLPNENNFSNQEDDRRREIEDEQRREFYRNQTRDLLNIPPFNK